MYKIYQTLNLMTIGKAFVPSPNDSTVFSSADPIGYDAVNDSLYHAIRGFPGITADFTEVFKKLLQEGVLPKKFECDQSGPNGSFTFSASAAAAVDSVKSSVFDTATVRGFLQVYSFLTTRSVPIPLRAQFVAGHSLINLACCFGLARKTNSRIHFNYFTLASNLAREVVTVPLTSKLQDGDTEYDRIAKAHTDVIFSIVPNPMDKEGKVTTGANGIIHWHPRTFNETVTLPNGFGKKPSFSEEDLKDTFSKLHYVPIWLQVYLADKQFSAFARYMGISALNTTPSWSPKRANLSTVPQADAFYLSQWLPKFDVVYRLPQDGNNYQDLLELKEVWRAVTPHNKLKRLLSQWGYDVSSFTDLLFRGPSNLHVQPIAADFAKFSSYFCKLSPDWQEIMEDVFLEYGTALTTQTVVGSPFYDLDQAGSPAVFPGVFLSITYP